MHILLNPLWPCLSCARIRRQSLRTSGTTMGVYNSLLSMSFHFKMLFSIVYVFWSKFLFSHCFLSCLMCGSLFCNLASLSSFRGRWISVFISIGSVCWMFMLPISHSITSSKTCVVTGGSSSNGKYPNSLPSGFRECIRMLCPVIPIQLPNCSLWSLRCSFPGISLIGGDCF